MKLFFSDMDGTLLDKNKTISEYTRTTIERFTADGNKFVLTSGRPLGNMIKMQHELGFDFPNQYIIAYNGAVVYDCDAGKAIYERTLPLDYVKELFHIAESFGVYHHTYQDDTILSPRMCDELIRYRKPIPMNYEIIEDVFSKLYREPYKVMMISSTDHALLERLHDAILATDMGSKITVAFSNPFYLESFSPEAGKGNGVRFLAEYLNVPMSQTYAAGDEANDISMIEAAGCGIAMSNANSEVKSHADLITRFDNNANGVADTIFYQIMN